MRSIVARLRAEVRAQGGGGVRVKCVERDTHEKGRLLAFKKGSPPSPIYCIPRDEREPRKRAESPEVRLLSSGCTSSTTNHAITHSTQ